LTVVKMTLLNSSSGSFGFKTSLYFSSNSIHSTIEIHSATLLRDTSERSSWLRAGSIDVISVRSASSTSLGIRCMDTR
jgi:hypothetical protein